MGEIPYYAYEFFKKGIEDGNNYYSLNQIRNHSAAFFANATYSYKGRYIVNGTTRREGTNRMGKSCSVRWLPTWNVLGAWNAHEEKFLNNLTSVLSHFTLKASHSLTADRGPADIMNSQAIITSHSPYRPFISVQEPGLYTKELENSELTYEKKHELNVGAGMGFLNDRTDLAVDWYKHNNYDSIGTVNIQGVGGQILKYVNITSMKSYGTEFTLLTESIRTKDSNWNTDLIFSNAKNEVTDLGQNANVMEFISGNGLAKQDYPVRGLFSTPFVGLDKDGISVIINEEGEATSTDINFQGRQNTGFLKYEGPIDPTITGSLGNMFSYKGFRLNLFITYSFGNVIRLNPVFKAYYSDLTAMIREFKSRWTLLGDETKTNVPATLSKCTYDSDEDLKYAYNAYNYSTECIVKGGFIRLKKISLAHDFSKARINPLRLTDLSLEAQAINFFLICADDKLNGQDPEFFNAGGVALSVPCQSTITLGLGL